MRVRHTTQLLGAAGIAAGAVLCSTWIPQASAAPPCPDVEVVFARGTGEAPGVGGIGQNFVDALRAQLGPRSLDVYPVNYAASSDFDNRDAFAATVIDGIRDAGDHIKATAANCPDTKVVLGGYSQGAAVAGFVTAPKAPAGVPVSLVPKPLPADVAEHVTAVTLFGKPSGTFLQKYGAPELTIGPLFTSKTLDLCAPGDAICDGSAGDPNMAHMSYGFNGMTGQAAAFAVDRIAPAPVPTA